MGNFAFLNHPVILHKPTSRFYSRGIITKQIGAYQEFSFYELRGISYTTSLRSDLSLLHCLECPVRGIIGACLLLFGAADGLRKRRSGRRSLCRSQMSNSWSRPRWCWTLTGMGSTLGRDSIFTPTSGRGTRRSPP